MWLFLFQNFDFGNFRPRTVIPLHAGKTISSICLFHGFGYKSFTKRENGTQGHKMFLLSRFRSLPILRYCFPSAFLSDKHMYDFFLYYNHFKITGDPCNLIGSK